MNTRNALEPVDRERVRIAEGILHHNLERVLALAESGLHNLFETAYGVLHTVDDERVLELVLVEGIGVVG